MAKAILVMDKPDNCADCPIHKTTGLCIPGIDADLHEWFDRMDLYLIETPDWCPLPALPERENTTSEYQLRKFAEEKGIPGPQAAGWKMGWNACLDEIEGGGNDEPKNI